MKHIVLLEDDEGIRDVFELIFAETNCDVISLSNAEKILNGVIDAPDLFILDKQLSGTNGLDVCRFIKHSEKFKQVPVVMLSANADIETLARDAGADDAIKKPFSIVGLRETIEQYVPCSTVRS